jgi:hypothetical protein
MTDSFRSISEATNDLHRQSFVYHLSGREKEMIIVSSTLKLYFCYGAIITAVISAQLLRYPRAVGHNDRVLPNK